MISTRVSAENYVCQSTNDEDDEFARCSDCLSFSTSQRHHRSSFPFYTLLPFSMNFVAVVRGRNVTFFFVVINFTARRSIKRKTFHFLVDQFLQHKSFKFIHKLFIQLIKTCSLFHSSL